MILKNELMDYLKGLETEDLLETLYLFGSWTNEQEKSARDLDLAAIFSPAVNPETIFWVCRNLQAKISANLQMPVDLIDLEMAPAYLGQVILQTGILIFCKDEERRMETTFSIYRNYRDESLITKEHRWEILGIDE